MTSQILTGRAPRDARPVKSRNPSQNPLSAAKARCRGLLWQAGGVSVFVNLLMLTGPLFMLQIYDRVLTSRSEPTLVALFVLVAALFAFLGILEFLRGRFFARTGARLQSALDGDVFKASIRAAREREPSQRRIGAVRDLEAVQQLCSGQALTAIFDLPWSPIFFAAIFLFHWHLGVLAVAGGVILVALALVSDLRGRRLAEDAQEAGGRAERFERSLRSGAEAAESLGMLPSATSRWSSLRNEALGAQIAASDRAGGYSAAIKALRLLLQSAILALGAWLAIQGQVSAGAIIAASILMGRALAPIEQAVGNWRSYARARLAWTNLMSIFEGKEASGEATALPDPEGYLEARSLAISPPGTEKLVLGGISFATGPGKALGVIGPSASGKSALARALVGLWPAARGALRIDGAAYDQWSLDQLGRHIGYLPQDVQLFDATVAENIARLDPGAEDSDVVEAARRAGAHELILGLPNGYDTPVGPSGMALSGGQRQRIGLARALYGDPSLIILDEPNAHLDADGEEAVVKVIRDLKDRSKSVVIMAHRPSAIAACDELLVLREGRQQSHGPRDEVLREVTANATHLATAAGGAA